MRHRLFGFGGFYHLFLPQGGLPVPERGVSHLHCSGGEGVEVAAVEGGTMPRHRRGSLPSEALKNQF